MATALYHVDFGSVVGMHTSTVKVEQSGNPQKDIETAETIAAHALNLTPKQKAQMLVRYVKSVRS